MIESGNHLDLSFRIPPSLSFADLQLRWGSDGQVLFEWSAIEQLCEASGVDVDLFKLTDTSNVARLINHWYEIHRGNGGAIDLVKEEAMSYGAHLSWRAETPQSPCPLTQQKSAS
ncbi:hypothetical protein KW843_24955 [Acidovorax sp. sif1233]|uniref:hypothetical protein n=1 Tax=Acidovorax sp. sif1233 TaxID=2854792 RepID=UPI001C44C68C|nr:hypothetical protein [Acidovorax sp. sif1233]MBV7457745.1 hypothetical protein [Acidovorax sp. sif1233]